MKYKYKNSGIEWIGEVPKHWKIWRIKDIAEMIMGQSPNSNDVNEEGEGLPFLQGNAEFGDKFPINKYWCPVAHKTAQEGDLLFSVRASIGDMNFADQKYGIGRGLCAIRGIKAKKEFLWFYLSITNQYFKSISTGTTFFAINTNDIRDLKVPFPPKTEQTAIAAYLDKACADIDRVVEIKRKQINNLQQQLKSIIHHTVTKGLDKNAELKETNEVWLGEIPIHWEFDRMKDIVELRNEKSDEKSEIEDYLELEDLEKETGRILGFRNTTEVASSVTVFKKGDVLFGKLRPYLNKHYLAKENGKCTGEILAFNCKKISNRFFEYCISSQTFIEKCTIVSYGAKMPRVEYTRQLAYFYLPIPPLQEQDFISNKLDKIKENTLTAQSKIEKQIETLVLYKKSLIHEVVTGKKQVYF